VRRRVLMTAADPGRAAELKLGYDLSREVSRSCQTPRLRASQLYVQMPVINLGRCAYGAVGLVLQAAKFVIEQILDNVGGAFTPVLRLVRYPRYGPMIGHIRND
jgi:hypothetical protein